jgi:hypothetical protein
LSVLRLPALWLATADVAAATDLVVDVIRTLEERIVDVVSDDADSEAEGRLEEDVVDAGAEELVTMALPLAEATGVEAKSGGGTAEEASTRAPVPQGILSPFGWSAFSGATVSPVEEATVKRVVH